MKLSNETLTVLQNFAKLNSGIEFKQGNTIRTMSTGKNVLAKATLVDSFPHDFCVYDLPQFLLVYNLSKDTEIDFDDSNVIFKFGRNKTKYRKSQKDTILVPPEKELALPSVDVSFTLTQEDFASILGTAAALQSPHIAVESDGEKIYLTACDAANDSAHTDSLEISKGDGNTYKMIFKLENIKMISGSYDVKISSKGVSHFKHKTLNVQYWISTETGSKYGV